MSGAMVENKAAILGERLNAATKYHYRTERGALQVPAAMLTRLCNDLHAISGRVDEPGLAPRLRYTLTERGKALHESHRKAYERTA